MRPKDLLSQLYHLESHLNDFSFEKLSADEAFLLKKSFQSFKRNLVQKILPSKVQKTVQPGEGIQKTKSTLGELTVDKNGVLVDIDIETYDAVVEHYRSYGAILQSLKIDSALKVADANLLIFNKSLSRHVDTSFVIDLQPILDQCMGEMDLLEELILLYERNVLEFIGKAKIHLLNTDFEQLELAAHKIKAGLAMMYTTSLHSIVEQMQNTCKQDQDVKHLQFLYDCFVLEYPMVRLAIADAIKNIEKR